VTVKCNSKKLDGKARTGLIWLRIRIGKGLITTDMDLEGAL
jgi:hypothetical protein